MDVEYLSKKKLSTDEEYPFDVIVVDGLSIDGEISIDGEMAVNDC